MSMKMSWFVVPMVLTGVIAGCDQPPAAEQAKHEQAVTAGPPAKLPMPFLAKVQVNPHHSVTFYGDETVFTIAERASFSDPPVVTPGMRESLNPVQLFRALDPTSEIPPGLQLVTKALFPDRHGRPIVDSPPGPESVAMSGSGSMDVSTSQQAQTIEPDPNGGNNTHYDPNIYTFSWFASRWNWRGYPYCPGPGTNWTGNEGNWCWQNITWGYFSNTNSHFGVGTLANVDSNIFNIAHLHVEAAGLVYNIGLISGDWESVIVSFGESCGIFGCTYQHGWTKFELLNQGVRSYMGGGLSTN